MLRGKSSKLLIFNYLLDLGLLPDVQLDDFHILGPVEHSIGENTLQQNTNAAEEDSEDERDKKNNSRQREHRENQVADIVALAQ